MDLNATPTLAPGCRLHPTESVLLIPEGTLNLRGPTREILSYLDGKHSVAAIVNELLKEYPDVDSDDLQNDVLGLLERMKQRGVVRA